MSKKPLLFAAVALLGITLLGQGCAQKPQDNSATPRDDQQESMTEEQNDSPTMAVPAPGFEGIVDEMIVNDESNTKDDTRMESDPEGTDPSEQMMQNEDSPNQNITVSYTDSGYSPKQITISKGTTVTWVNNSSRQMWTASNDHPSHLIYSAFDQLKATGPGTTYSFTFDRSGTWGYHNHVNARHLGTVVVQ